MADRSAITLEEFKARLPLVEIVSRHVRLTRRGREHLGLCPFHQEKTPSFTVSEGKGFYHCFGCGQHGNAIDFVMALEGLDFSQAVQRLAELTGLPVPRLGGEAAPAIDQTLYAANAAAMRWFAGRLESASGAAAAAYLAGRGLDQETIQRFGLGYAPDDRTALKRALQAEGYPEASLLEAGLLIRPDDGGPSYDRFRQRVIFPIHDRRGRVVGFGGRALGEARAKYLNTADTPLFHKGELLYGLALARPAVRERGTVIVAEGYMDVIALAQAGFANAVAPLGTAVSEAQLALLWQLADEPLICLDSDEAGLRAAHRLVERALPLLKPGKSLRFALLPAGQDPDSLLRAAGREALARRLDDALPLVEFLWRRERAGRSFVTPERRAAFAQRCHELAQMIGDQQLRWLFRQELQQRLRSEFAAYEPRRRGQRATVQGPAPAGVGARRLAASIARPEIVAARQLFEPILIHAEFLHEVEEEFAALEFSEPELDALQGAILCWYGESGHLDPDQLSNHLSGIGFAGLVKELLGSGASIARSGGDEAPAVAGLDGWRESAARYREFAERRAVTQAGSVAVAEQRDDAGARVLAIDRLINPADRAGVGRRPARDLGR
jgi:DNA primase